MTTQRTDWHLLAFVRFLLAFIVLSGHLRCFVDQPTDWMLAFDAFGGKAAVMGFLLVSGYSIGASLERGQPGFYRRRFLRIYPLYLTALLVSAALQFTAGEASALNLPAVVNGGTGALTFVGNLFLLQTFVVKPLAFDGPVWSLAVEASFYVVAPLFVRMKRSHLMLLVAFSALCYSLPTRTDWGMPYYVLTKLNASRYLWCWLLGLLLRLEGDRAVFGLALLGVGPILVAPQGTEPLAAVTYLATLSCMVAASRLRTPRRLRAAADYLGDLSYPLYLMHFPAFIFGFLYCGARTPLPLLGLAVLLTLAAYYLVERLLKPRVIEPWLMRILRPEQIIHVL